MIAEILGAVATGGLSTIAGGVTGLVGGIFKGIAEGKQRKHQIKLYKLQLEAQAAERKAALEEASLNIESAERIAEQAAESEKAQAVESTARAAYRHDIALGSETGFIGVLRRSVRPVLTYFTFIFVVIALVLSYRHWQPTQAEAHQIFTYAVQLGGYLTVMAWTFWFVDRQRKPPKLK